MPETVDEPELGEEEEMATQPQAKGMGPARHLGLSKHPFVAEGSKNKPDHGVVNRLDDMLQLLSTKKEGQHWYDWLVQAIDYDLVLVNACANLQDIEEELASAKQKIIRHHQRADKRQNDRIEDIEQQLLDMQEKLTHKELEITQLQKEKDELVERLTNAESISAIQRHRDTQVDAEEPPAPITPEEEETQDWQKGLEIHDCRETEGGLLQYKTTHTYFGGFFDTDPRWQPWSDFCASRDTVLEDRKSVV